MVTTSQTMILRPRSSDTRRPRLSILRHAGSFSRCSVITCWHWMLLSVCILVVWGESSAVPVLAVRHNCSSLQQAVVDFMRALGVQDMAIQEWLQAVVSNPGAEVEITSLPVEPPTETSARDPVFSEATPTTQHHSGNDRTSTTATPSSVRPQTTTLLDEAVTYIRAPATAHSEATPITRPHSDDGHTPTAATATPFPICPSTAPLDDVAVSRYRSLSDDGKGRKLIYAAQKGAVGEMRALLAAGADVRARGDFQLTALHHAAYWGRVEATRCLLQVGAEVGARESRGQATPLHVAALSGDAAVVRLLLAASADINARDARGWTPLHYAAYWGEPEAATVLLEAGARRGSRTDKGKTPLDIAREENYQQLVQILERY